MCHDLGSETDWYCLTGTSQSAKLVEHPECWPNKLNLNPKPKPKW